MQDTQKNLSPKTEDAVKKSNRRTLIAILAVALLPIIAAYTMFFSGIGVPQNTVNNGILLSKAVKIQDLISDKDDVLIKAIADDKLWRLVIPITGACNQDCQQNLYTTRQVHIRLGEKSTRVERYTVNLAGEIGRQYLESIAADHPRLKNTSADLSAWQSWIQNAGLTRDIESQPYYLLVDQEGYAMMYYDAEIHGNLLLKDIKRALKYSIDYQ